MTRRRRVRGLPADQRRPFGVARISKNDTYAVVPIARQRENVSAHAAAMNLPIAPDDWVEDVGSAWGVAESRGAKGRTKWDEVLGRIRSGEHNVVFAYMQDRLIRDLDDAMELLKACQETGTMLNFQAEGGQTDVTEASSKTNYLLKSVMAQNESDVKSRRVIDAARQRGKDGRAHAAVLYGWRREYVTNEVTGARVKGEWHDVLNDEQAKIVKECARRVLAGESINGIAADLNERGVPTARKTEDGKSNVWMPSTIRRMLVRPANAGLRVYFDEQDEEKTVVAKAPAILDAGDWTRLVAYLQDPTRKVVTDNRVRHLLSGIAKCGVCGSGARVWINSGGVNVRRYVCTTGHVSRQSDPVDFLVTEAVIDLLVDEERITRLLSGDDTAALEAAKEAADLRASLLQLDDQRYSPIKAERMDDARYKRQVARLRPQLEAAERAARSTRSRVDDTVSELIGPKAAELFAALPITRQRAVVDALFDIAILPYPKTRNTRAPFDGEYIRITPKH